MQGDGDGQEVNDGPPDVRVGGGLRPMTPPLNRQQRRAAAAPAGPPGRAARRQQAAPATPTGSVTALFAEAVNSYRAGRLADVESYCRQVLALDGEHAHALHMLGIVAYQGGQLRAAVDFMTRAIARERHIAAFHSNLGNALRDLGQPDAAIASYAEALRLEPGFAQAHFNLANAWSDQGQTVAAISGYERALVIEPAFAEALANLGNALASAGQTGEAVAHYEQALAIRPDFPEALYNLANALRDQGALAAAVRRYEQALVLRPAYAKALVNLGNVLKEQGRIDLAIPRYQLALAAQADLPETLSNLGLALQAQGRADAALAYYRQAIALQPGTADLLCNLGTALADLGDLEQAAICYERALVLQADAAPTLANLGNALRGQGQAAAAQACYRQAQALRPDSLAYALGAAMALPCIAASPLEIAEARQAAQTGLAALAEAPDFATLVDPSAELGIVSFHLAYQGADDRALMQQLSRLLRARAPTLTYSAPHTRSWTAPQDPRIRIGICSQYLITHTIGKLYQGLIRHLDRLRFELVLIHAPHTRRDIFSAQLDRLADEVLSLSGPLRAQQQAVAAARLDVLFYPDIGMSPATYYLAYARLAPVQVVSWGHPDTTGIDTVDYFLSAASIEPADADAHYSERLIRLRRLPCFYQALIPSAAASSRAALGLPQDGTLYGCPQSLFKLHPDFDAVLAEIAAGDPTGHIVLLDSKIAHWRQLLRQRWAATHPLLLDRVVFLPRLPLDRFMALMAQFDVLLDPIHFGSGNTLYEAMVDGIPTVTWPGRQMRGRIVAGAYAQMRVAGAPIAAQLADYAPLALALGRDPQRRATLRALLRENASALFEDFQSVREFEVFVEAAVAAARCGEKLPAGWQPPAQTEAADV